MSLTLILATRSRPGFLVRTVQQTLANIKRDDTRLVIAADADDDGTLSTKSVLYDPRIIWSVKEREDSLGAKYNRVLTEAPSDLYGVMVDYAPFITEGFDEKIVEASSVYSDGYYVIVNHLANLSFSQINVVSHKMTEAMGYLYSEMSPYWFVDHWLEDIAFRIERHVFCDVSVDTSARGGGANWTQELREPVFWGQVFDALQGERLTIAQKIINAPDFNDSPDRKAALLRNQQLVFEWSHIINRGLPSGGPPGDERYNRHKSAMIQKLDALGLITRDEQKAA